MSKIISLKPKDPDVLYFGMKHYIVVLYKGFSNYMYVPGIIGHVLDVAWLI